MKRVLRLTFSLLLFSFASTATVGNDWIKEFSSSDNIIFDVRNARFGFGDITANTTSIEYLYSVLGESAPEIYILVDRGSYERTVSVINDSSILKNKVKLIAQNPSDIDTSGSQLSVSNIPAVRIQYYFHLARRLGTYHQESGLPPLFAQSDSNGASVGQQILMDPNGVRVVLPVFAGAESILRMQRAQSTSTYGMFGFMQIGATEQIQLLPPGISFQSELGVYPDPIALNLSMMNESERLQNLRSTINDLPLYEKERLTPLYQLFSDPEILKGASRAIMYRMTLDSKEQDHKTYFTNALSTLASLSTGPEAMPIVLLTPDDFQSLTLPKALADKVEILSLAQEFPAVAESGKIYVIETERIPRSIFTTVLSLSTGVNIASGDGTLSSIAILNKRFKMVRVAWNERVADSVPSYNQRLISNQKGVKHLGETLFPMVAKARSESLRSNPSESRNYILKSAFSEYTIPSLFEQIGSFVAEICGKLFKPKDR